MLRLMAKDLITQKKKLVVVFILLAVISFAFAPQKDGAQSFLVGLAFISMFGTLVGQNAFYYDELSHFDVYLNALPVKKSNVVAARYINCILISFVSGLLYILVSFMISAFSGYELSTQPYVFLVPFVLIILMISLTFPILYKFSFSSARIAAMAIIFAIGFGVSGALSVVEKDKATDIVNYISNVPSSVMYVGTVIVCLFLLCLSYYLSLHFYKKKEW